MQTSVTQAIKSTLVWFFSRVQVAWIPQPYQYFVHYCGVFATSSLVVPLVYWYTGWWPLGIISPIFLFLFLFIVYVYVNERLLGIYTTPVTGKFLYSTLSIVVIGVSLSFVGSCIAINLIPASMLDTVWYTENAKRLAPTFPFLQTILCLPFYIATVAVTIGLLRCVVRWHGFFVSLALLNTLVSLMLSILLHTLLKLIDGGSASGQILGHWMNSVDWFEAVGRGLLAFALNQEAIRVTDLHLLPMLIMTFVPVFIYTMVFVLVVVSRPVMWVTGRLLSFFRIHENLALTSFTLLIIAFGALVMAFYALLTGLMKYLSFHAS